MWLGVAPDLLVERGDREGDRHVRPARRFYQYVEVAHDHRPAGDDAERIGGLRHGHQAGTGQAEATLGRLVRVSGRADSHQLALPAAPGQLAAEHLRNVRLDPDGCPVAIIGWTLSAALERPDVAERALVGATGVRVEGPLEAHALDAVQRTLAGLLAVLGAQHSRIIERPFCSGRRVAPVAQRWPGGQLLITWRSDENSPTW